MAADDHNRDGASPWLFLLGLALFVASGLLFLFDLVRGVDVLRSIGANGVATAVLILWAALDTLQDPDSEVATAGGAAGTALLLYGLYLLAAGAVVAATGLVHPYMRLGFYYVGLAVVAVILGAIIFPSEALVDDESPDSPADDQSTDKPAGDQPADSPADEQSTDGPTDDQPADRPSEGDLPTARDDEQGDAGDGSEPPAQR